MGDPDSERGFVGLALQAGSRSAIGTLWYVDDVATSAFFVLLYRNLEQGLPKAEALQATRRSSANGQVRLKGDQILGPDANPLLQNLTLQQQRRVGAGLHIPSSGPASPCSARRGEAPLPWSAGPSTAGRSLGDHSGVLRRAPSVPS
jgi:hypothetical protein